MKTNFLLALIALSGILSFSCEGESEISGSTEISSKDSLLSIITDQYLSANDIPFNLTLSTEKISAQAYNLVIKIELREDHYYYASPLSNNSFKGLLAVEFDDPSIKKSDVFLEEPLSKAEIDSFSGEPVNWVRETTTYRQKFQLLNEDDAVIKGNLAFVVEPICSRYQVDFNLSFKDKEFTIWQDGTKYANL